MSDELSFDERGLPTRGRPWDGRTLPELRRFEVTATGRRARGELDELVDHCVKAALITGDDLSAAGLAGSVEHLDGVPTSAASVASVLRRWERIGYAEIDTHPMRLVDITKEGRKLGPSEMARRYRRRNRASHYKWD